jgi:hypothetical protein
MLHQNALISARITELEEQLAVITKQKSRKRKRIQHSGTLEYREASTQVAAKATVARQSSKQSRGSNSHTTVTAGLRRCGNCGGTGHNARTCRKDIEVSSESDSSTQYIGSLFDSDEN